MKHAWMGLVLLATLAACSQQKSPVAEMPAPAPAAGPALAANDDFPKVLQASGTEPFWGVRVDGGKLEYTTPETQATPRHFEGERRVSNGQLQVQGGTGDNAFHLTINRATCSDGMSDLSHAFTAEFVLGKQTFKGCARDPAVPMEAP